MKEQEDTIKEQQHTIDSQKLAVKELQDTVGGQNLEVTKLQQQLLAMSQIIATGQRVDLQNNRSEVRNLTNVRAIALSVLEHALKLATSPYRRPCAPLCNLASLYRQLNASRGFRVGTLSTCSVAAVAGREVGHWPPRPAHFQRYCLQAHCGTSKGPT
jgi:hypothetical protein